MPGLERAWIRVSGPALLPFFSSLANAIPSQGLSVFYANSLSLQPPLNTPAVLILWPKSLQIHMTAASLA